MSEGSTIPRLSTRCGPLDDLLGGGVETDTLTEFYGGAGSGKTNICLSLALSAAAKGHRVIYIDTEGISAERLGQMAEDPSLLKDIIIYHPFSMTEQKKLVDKAVRLARSQAKIGLIILDSATVYYRLDYHSDDTLRKNLLSQILGLLSLARQENVAVVIANQVYTDVETDILEPVGGYVLRHNAKTIVRLDWVSPNVREAVLMKHRSRPEGESARFSITATGLGPAD